VKINIYESSNGPAPDILPPCLHSKWGTGRFHDVIITTPRLVLDGVEKDGFGKGIEGYYFKMYRVEDYSEDILKKFSEIGSLRLHPNGEVEYYVSKYEGNGYATEAVEAVKAFMLEKGVSPTLRIEKTNIRSQRVAKKTKFTPVAELPAIENFGEAYRYELQ